jgi:hypothetical protein
MVRFENIQALVLLSREGVVGMEEANHRDVNHAFAGHACCCAGRWLRFRRSVCVVPSSSSLLLSLLLPPLLGPVALARPNTTGVS